MRDKKALIVGGGIGGLSAALSLHAIGIQVEVFEQAGEVRPLGVGINLLPHAVRELTELGLAEVLASRAIETERLVYANQKGQEIWSEPCGVLAGYNWPQFSIHRGVLQMLLLEAVLDRVGSAHVHLGCRAVGAETTADGAEVTFQSQAGASIAHGDLVVAADGIHSALRAQFYPEEGEPRWNGHVLWRGVSDWDPFKGGYAMAVIGHQDEKFVCYPISPEAARRGRSLLNWIAELRGPPADAGRKEDWSCQGRLEDFLPAFERWKVDWLDVAGVIRSASCVYEYPVLDRDPISRWTFGRVTLLGDAAHPMYPIGSNGASQAILDARTLAFHLATAVDVDTALDRYEAARRPATSNVVLANRRNGPGQVMQLVHQRAPDGFSCLDDVVSREELETVIFGYKRVAGFEPTSLNARPSLTPATRLGSNVPPSPDRSRLP